MPAENDENAVDRQMKQKRKHGPDRLLRKNQLAGHAPEKEERPHGENRADDAQSAQQQPERQADQASSEAARAARMRKMNDRKDDQHTENRCAHCLIPNAPVEPRGEWRGPG